MIRFNRAISPISVLSFDLDDTLYNNHPIIQSALQAQTDYLASLPNWPTQSADYWQQCREHVVIQNPELIDDVTQWRKATLYHAIAALGFTQQQAQRHAKLAYQAFADARSKITVTEDVLRLLAALNNKYRLIAITNGNVEVEQFNLKGVFELVLQAGPHGKAKPHHSMFTQAVQKLKINPQQLLHIGDSLDTDVQGANNAGCHTVWLNNQPQNYTYKGLADIEINSIFALECFL
ncbi:HAD-IA family hydrolase [Pseudoalteromonas mariniglutinosa]|uniref:HAD-IA family hydrolase n=1 Tax=Pseudoalteromonas mariniglutinosa TaxID=206042 RepID=UPI00384E3A37